ncbi:hypothetical protein RAS2_08090 [Phycisphaerae bacterium RAS2]|nr:hypothetical protein RAS2_08090 [Phycisphaerae bacterium RAS2]
MTLYRGNPITCNRIMRANAWLLILSSLCVHLYLGLSRSYINIRIQSISLALSPFSIAIIHYRNPTNKYFDQVYPVGIKSFSMLSDELSKRATTETWRFHCSLHKPKNVVGLQVPCWLPLGFLVCLIIYLRHSARASYRKPGNCHGCGYDLHRNTFGCCPECGMVIPEDQRALMGNAISKTLDDSTRPIG